jgi:choline dehydrogenase-like flavoprotein
MTPDTHYDVVIVGSGAGGGQAAYTLTMAGAKVLMIEAGRHFDPATTPMFQINSHAPLRGAPTPDKQLGFYDGTAGGGWTIPGEPYVNDSADPRRQFMWWRSRMLGGRTNHWGRIALRFGPYDFKPYSRDGLGVDWPVSYEEVAPYYDKVEMLIGVFGAAEGIENSPDSPAGVLLPPPPLRAGERLVAQRGKKLGLTVAPIHRAVLSVRQDADTLPAKLHPHNPKAQRILAEAMRQRAACFWATDCHRGCSIKANYQSTTVHLPPALATGNLEVITDAMVREVTLDAAGKATGVLYFDKKTGQERRASGRVVVLAAGSQESVRILLNSKSALFPQGLANSSGILGRYIMDTPQSSFRGQVPLLEDLPLHSEDGAGIHAYVPWGFYREQRSGQLDFPRGYHIQFTTGRQLPSFTTGSGLEWLTGGSYGRQFKEDQRRYYGSLVGFGSVGEMVPNEDCYSELDPVMKDKWGIPVLRFHWQWSEYEVRQAVHAQKISAELISALGGKFQKGPETDGRKVLTRGGEIIHEVGGARMGVDRKKSVTNAWGRTWDVKNLFLVDGATFASNADKNPTLTILALAWRTSDHILEQLAQGEL